MKKKLVQLALLIGAGGMGVLLIIVAALLLSGCGGGKGDEPTPTATPQTLCGWNGLTLCNAHASQMAQAFGSNQTKADEEWEHPTQGYPASQYAPTCYSCGPWHYKGAKISFTVPADAEVKDSAGTVYKAGQTVVNLGEFWVSPNAAAKANPANPAFDRD